MAKLNYFQMLCFFWAGLGILSRLLMGLFGEKWKKWELEKAYRVQKPKWLRLIAILGISIIIYSWYAVFSTGIPYGWIIAVLVSISALKLFMLTFRYDRFRAFVVIALNSRSKMLRLNFLVLSFSALCIAMAVFLY